MLSRPAVLAVAVLATAACTAESNREDLVRAPAVEVLGEPVNCVLTSRIRNTDVQDDYTIDFLMVGGDVYRNTLPRRCPNLGFDEAFAYQNSTGQLCDIELITVINNNSAGRGPSCSLGKFVPVRYLDETG